MEMDEIVAIYKNWVSCQDCADFDECENKENCDGCLAGEEIHAAWEYHSANHVGLITVACSNCGHKQTGIAKRCPICRAIMDEGKL